MRIFLIVLSLMMQSCFSMAAPADENPLVVLCYHSVLEEVDDTDLAYFSVPEDAFVEQLEYLKEHNYTVVSLQQVLDAKNGRKALPEKPVLLSFDDGYLSFYSSVYPILKRFGYPSMLAVVGSWIEGNAPDGLPEPLMTWPQIKEVMESGLVEIVSHSFALHQGIPVNPQGNKGPSASFRAYLPYEQRYETEQEYQARLDLDFKCQRDLFMKRIGIIPRAMVWPYGSYSEISVESANKYGIQITFNLNENNIVKHFIDDPRGVNRFIVHHPLSIGVLAYFIENFGKYRGNIRAAQVDIDLMYEPGNPEQTDKNLGRVIDRLVAMGVTTVFLQAFDDRDGDGVVRKVYFHTDHFPVEADVFSHMVDRIKAREIDVYAWMPTLALQFPDKKFNETYGVRRYHEGKVELSTEDYKRLTPFAAEVRQRMAALYKDLAASADLNGVLFQDDAYLDSNEDMHPEALKAFFRHTGRTVDIEELLEDDDISRQWMEFKALALDEYLAEMKKAVWRYRPDAVFARNIYAMPVLHPESEEWFAQNYMRFLENYDYTVIMAYPQMERAKKPCAWLKKLVAKALEVPGARDKVIFKLQTWNWRKNVPVPKKLFYKEMRTVLAAFARHLAYYPDNFWENVPDLNTARLEMSSRGLPE